LFWKQANNNPTGSYIKENELQQLNDLCCAKGLPLICDEVFLDFDLSKEGSKSLAGNTESLTFTLSGISKILGMPQMKLSWIIVNGSEDLVSKAVERLEVIADTYLSVSTPIQNAFVQWIESKDPIQSAIKDRTEANLRLLEEYVVQKEGVELFKPEGGWYSVLKISSVESEEDFVISLLKDKKVFVHPGYFFDFPGQGYIVVSLLPEQEQFQEGCESLFLQ